MFTADELFKFAEEGIRSELVKELLDETWTAKDFINFLHMTMDMREELTIDCSEDDVKEWITDNFDEYEVGIRMVLAMFVAVFEDPMLSEYMRITYGLGYSDEGKTRKFKLVKNEN